MAFNPFHRFRKHQKVFFAGLTIVCMIVFVFQFGAGDPFTRLLGWFGAGRARGEVVAKLYGKKVKEGDLKDLAHQRTMADEFLRNYVAGLGMQTIRKELQKLKDQAPDGRFVEDVLRGSESGGPRDYGRIQEEMRRFQGAFFTIQKNEAVERIREDTAFLLAIEAWKHDPDNRPGPGQPPPYFLGGTRRPEDLLDFRIWLHEAERLGIVLTDADVRREVNREGGNVSAPLEGKTFADDPRVRFYLGNLRRSPDANPQKLLDALRDEFRVQMAQEAILGAGSGVRAYRADILGLSLSPAATTPDEYLEYFRRQRTIVKAALLTVPVEHFLSQVKDKPTEQDLLNRFNEHKDQVPAPDKREPGFKEPRRFKIEYASVQSDNPYYKAQARLATEYLGRLRDSAVAAPAAAPFLGGPAGWASAAVGNFIPDPVWDAYQGYAAEVERLAQDNLVLGIPIPQLQDAKVQTAAIFGQTFGAALAPNGVLGIAPIAPATTTLFRQTAARAKAASILAPTAGSPLGAMGLAFPNLYTRQSFATVRPRLRQEQEKMLAQHMLDSNIQGMEILASPLVRTYRGNRQNLEKVLKEMVREFHFDYHAMQRPQTQYEWDTDPVLKPFKEAYTKAEANKPEAKDFMDLLLHPPGLFGMNFGQEQPVSLFEVRVFRTPKKDDKHEVFLFWRSEDIAPRPRPFAAVRDQVEASWRLDKARSLALRAADRINAEWKKLNTPADAEKFLRDQKLGPVFTLDNVSRLVKPPLEPFVPNATEFRPYRVPRDKREFLRYPPANLTDVLVDLPKRGASTVFRDQPVRNFYVSILLERSVPSMTKFVERYEKAPQGNDPIWEAIMNKSRQDYAQTVMKQLRIDAVGKGGVDGQGNIRIPEDVRAHLGGAGESSQ